MEIRAYSDPHGFLPRIEPRNVLRLGDDICPIDREA